MEMAEETTGALLRVHDRLDQLFAEVAKISANVAQCIPCRETVHRHDEAIFGDGTEGLAVRMKSMEEAGGNLKARMQSIENTQSAGDRLSIGAWTKILSAVGALVSLIAGAIGAAVAAALK
jgi:hypothetical protein